MPKTMCAFLSRFVFLSIELVFLISQLFITNACYVKYLCVGDEEKKKENKHCVLNVFNKSSRNEPRLLTI